jgi:serine/threonine protein kinase
MILAPGYRVLSQLSRGRVLDTYEVWSEERECICVAKVLRPELVRDPTSRRRLRDEARIVGGLSHPHIVRAYEVRLRPHPLLVLEALTGETLAHLIKRRSRRLPAAEIAALGLHLCSAIAYLHRRGYLHLDVKPSNVVCEGGQAKVIDLSLARPPGRGRPSVGTRIYLAPEQALGALLTEATDVWGIGGVLYEAAARRRAFSGEGHPQVTERAEPIRARRRLPPALADAIDACLDPLPGQRPTTAELAAVCDALV